MNSYNIWREGFMIQGMDSPATAERIGTEQGETFQDACARLMEHKKSTTYDPRRNTDWGCRLFDNEAAARKSLG